MGIISKFLISSAKNNDIKSVTLALAFDKTLKSFKNFFLAIDPFSNERSFDINNNQSLNHALQYAAKSLNCEMMSVLINFGANIHSVDENEKNIITHAVESLATSKNLKLETAKNLPKEIIFHPIMQLLLKEGAEYYSTDDLNIETSNASQNIRGSLQPPNKPPRTFEYQSKNTKVYGSDSQFEQCSSSSEGEPIYAEIDDLMVNNSLNDSGYLSISEESPYAAIDDILEQEKPVILQQQKELKEILEPIYAKVDLEAKRRARAKGIQSPVDNKTTHSEIEITPSLTKHTVAGIYLKKGLIQERIDKYEQSIEEKQNSNVEPQTNTQKIKSGASSNVEQIKQKYKNWDSGYDSGYESDTKMERLRMKHDLPKIPHSKVNSVRVKCGMVEGHRYRT